MKVEIITSSPCTACDGSDLVLNPRGGKLDCPNRCKRGVIVRKTTFADAAALVAVLAPALRRAQWGHWGAFVPDGDDTLSSLTDTAVEGYFAMARRVAEMALGVTNEPQ